MQQADKGDEPSGQGDVHEGMRYRLQEGQGRDFRKPYRRNCVHA